MRTALRRSWILLASSAALGCSSPGTNSAAVATAARADQMTTTKACVMQSGGVDVLRLTAPAATKCAATDGSLKLDAPHSDVELWLVRGASSVDDGVRRAGPQIVDEFRDFKADHATDLTVAGSPAKRLVGTGHEADDGDDGAADVLVFTVGGRVFVACDHGERLDPASRQEMLTLVQTAQVP